MIHRIYQKICIINDPGTAGTKKTEEQGRRPETRITLHVSVFSLFTNQTPQHLGIQLFTAANLSDTEGRENREGAA